MNNWEKPKASIQPYVLGNSRSVNGAVFSNVHPDWLIGDAIIPHHRFCILRHTNTYGFNMRGSVLATRKEAKMKELRVLVYDSAVCRRLSVQKLIEAK